MLARCCPSATLDRNHVTHSAERFWTQKVESSELPAAIFSAHLAPPSRVQQSASAPHRSARGALRGATLNLNDMLIRQSCEASLAWAIVFVMQGHSLSMECHSINVSNFFLN